MSKVLDGYRVLELAVIQAGPYAATMLGDMGAEVIKVEQPNIGDPMRYTTAMLGGQSVMMPNGRKAVWEDIDHSKKSVTIDISKPEGKQIFYELIDQCDVFITNFRDIALKRMGFDYETLQKRNPRLIYGWSTTAGLKGPEKDIAGIDLVAQARTGIMMHSGDEGMSPIMITPGLCDRATSLTLAYGVVSALLAREKTGKGQRVHVSMLNVMTNLQGFSLGPLFMVGCDLGRWKRETNNTDVPLSGTFYQFYECKGGEWIALGLYPAQRYYPEICKLLEIPHVFEDPRFEDDTARLKHTHALQKLLAEAFRKKTRAEWLKILGQSKSLIFGPIQTPRDLINDPQMIANDYIREWDHPVEGPTKYLGYQVEFSETPMEISREAPELGQHTEEVLNEVLGYDWEKLAKLRQDGVL